MRYYSTTVGEMTLQSGITAGDTSIVVDTTAGLPVSFPYTLILDYGASAEEVVSVTAAATTTLTVTRAQDGTIAQSHALGAVVRHGVTARDLRESREHEAAETGVHGATGDVVGTTDTQTLTNKDLSSGTNTFPSTLATDAEVAAAIAPLATSASVTAALAAHAELEEVHWAQGAIVGTENAQTLTNKTISGASNTLSAIPQSAVTDLTTDLAAVKPICVMGQITPQAVANATVTDVVMHIGGTLIDIGGMVDTFGDRIVIQVSGIYRFSCHVPWVSDPDGYRAALIRNETQSKYVGQDYRDAVATSATIHDFTTVPVECNAGDVIILRVVQTSGGNLDLGPANARYVEFGAEYVASLTGVILT